MSHEETKVFPSNPPPVIAIVGSANIDLTAYGKELPSAGQTLTGEAFSQGFGGKGANQAVMSALAGGKVYFVGAIGNDEFGNSVLSNFQKYNIDTRNITSLDTFTGVAHIWVDGHGENRILIIPGANGHIDANKVRTAIENIPDLRIVVGQCEIPQEATLAAFEAAKARGVITILNPAPYQELLPELLEVSDWLVPNQTEFAELDPHSRLPDSDELIASLRPSQNLIVTLGESGVAIAEPGRGVARVPSPKVDMVDSTGAGDCFIGAFATALGNGLDPARSATFATRVAALSVTKKGAQTSYPSIAEMRQILELMGE